MFAIFSPPSTLFFFMRLAHLTDDCCVRYGGKSETSHQIATESSRMYEIKKKKVDGLECALLQVQRLPHIKTLVRRPPPPKKILPNCTSPNITKRLPRTRTLLSLRWSPTEEATWKRTRLSEHKRKHGYSAGGKDARGGKSNDNDKNKRNKLMRWNRKKKQKNPPPTTTTAKWSLTRNCGLTVKHLQRRTPRSAVPVVVRHFGAKAGRVVSSWRQIHNRPAGAGQLRFYWWWLLGSVKNEGCSGHSSYYMLHSKRFHMLSRPPPPQSSLHPFRSCASTQ